MFQLAQYSQKPPQNMKNNLKIPGVSFSWRRLLGIDKVKREIAKTTGIPTTRAGMERKIGNAIIKTIFGKGR